MYRHKYIILFFFLIFTGLSEVQAQSETINGSALFGSMRARHIGPAVMSGRISSLDVVETKPEIMYVGTAGGGIWKSNSAGASLMPVFDDYTMSIGKITIDQQHPDTVWVGTGETWVRNSVSVGTGIYRSTNGGTTWEFKGLGRSERISDIIISNNDPNTIYAGVLGHLWNASEDRGIYKTTNGGDSWERIFFIDANTGCADMDVDPENPDVLYAAMWEFRRQPDFFTSGGPGSGLFKSIDGGISWKRIQNGLPDETLGRMAVAVAPSNNDVVYVTIEVKDKTKKGLYRSADAGENWGKVNSDFNTIVRPFYFSRMEVDPGNDSIVFKCGLDLTISKDRGESFRTVGSNVHSDIHDVWINPANTNHIIIGTDGGVYESYDGGYLFKMFMNLPVSQFYHVSVDMEKPFNVYGGLQDNGSWYGPSKSPGGITNQDWKMTYGGDGFYSFRHPADKDIIYAEYQGGEIMRYNEKTGQAKSIKPYPEKGEPDLRFNWNAPIHLSPDNPERMYFGSQFLLKTEDRGESWERISPDLTTNDPERQRQKKSGGLSIDNSTAENNTTIYAIAESPVNENIIWVGTDDGYLHVTSDGGQIWTNVISKVPGLPMGTWVSFIEPGHFEKNTAYVTFDGHRTGDMKSYLYKTTDLGQSWIQLTTDDIEGYCLSVREDYKNRNLLFLGTEFGLYITIDGGSSWSRFENNLPRAGIRDMVIHPRDHALVLATHGRGIVIIDDITPLRQLTSDVTKEDLHFFTTEPTELRDPGSGTSWFNGAGNFVGSNPPEAARIIYYMSKRHTFGKMYLEIYDDKGNFIREAPAGKSAGINIVEIPVRSRKPKAPPTNNRMALVGSMFGPALPAGTYKVKLNKGKNIYESEFVLAYDPSSPYTLEDRAIQYEYTHKLYKMTEDLAYIYYALNEMTDQAKDRAMADKKLENKLLAFAGTTEQLGGSLVALGGDFYVDEDEQIGELIAQLYRYVSSYPGRPSDSQISRTEILNTRLVEVKEKFRILSEVNMQKINDSLVKNELQPISLQTKEDFLKD
jgi:photosystem II stability/assembly factor-like uncharacterized protein